MQMRAVQATEIGTRIAKLESKTAQMDAWDGSSCVKTEGVTTYSRFGALEDAAG